MSIIYYCKNCNEKPYFRKEEGKPRDGLCPECNRRLEPLVVNEEELKGYTHYSMVGFVESKQGSREKNKKDKKKVTKLTAENNKIDEEQEAVIEEKQKEVSRKKQKEHIDRTEKKVIEEDVIEDVPINTAQRRSSMIKDDFEFENARGTSDVSTAKRYSSIHKDQSSKMRNEDSSQASNQKRGKSFVLRISGTRLMETYERSWLQKVWDKIVYGQSLGDTYNVISGNIVSGEGWQPGESVNVVFYGRLRNDGAGLNDGTKVEVKGAKSIGNLNEIYMRRMSRNEAAEKVRKDKKDILFEFVFMPVLVFALFLLFYVLSNLSFIKMKLGIMFERFVEIFVYWLVLEIICGGVVFSLTSRWERLRNRYKVLISIAISALLTYLLFV